MTWPWSLILLFVWRFFGFQCCSSLGSPWYCLPVTVGKWSLTWMLWQGEHISRSWGKSSGTDFLLVTLMFLFLAEDSQDELQSSDCFLLREIRNLSDSLVQSFRVCLSLYHKFTMAWMYLTHVHPKELWEARKAFQQLQTLCLWRPGQLTQDCRFWVGVEDWLARRSRSYELNGDWEQRRQSGSCCLLSFSMFESNWAVSKTFQNMIYGMSEYLSM